MSDISIQQLDFPDNGVDQPFDPGSQSSQGVTLYSGQPGETYGVGVTWADGSTYNTTVSDNFGGNLIDVPGPDQGANLAQTQDPQQVLNQVQSTINNIQDPSVDTASIQQALNQAQAALNAAQQQQASPQPPAQQ